MSAAASAATVRRNPAPASAPAQHVAASPQAQAFSFVEVEDEIRINLGDVELPRNKDMTVEGFKPSLLSRLLDLVSPHK